MQLTKSHQERVQKELRQAGMTKMGIIRFASTYLPNVIQEEEHIEAVVYGRYSSGTGLLKYSEGMLIATNERIIFLDHKPGFTSMDELTYDMVAGLKQTAAGLFASITLHTRIGDYTIRFANRRCLGKFARYVEIRRLEQVPLAMAAQEIQRTAADEAALDFLRAHDIAVLSTVDRLGNVSGAVVYYIVDDDNHIYILTKGETQKAHNVFAHHQVALTVFEASKAQTAQLQGVGEIEADQAVKDRVFAQIVRPRPYDGETHLPPVTTLHKGAYIILRITPTSIRFTDYKKRAHDDLSTSSSRASNASK